MSPSSRYYSIQVARWHNSTLCKQKTKKGTSSEGEVSKFDLRKVKVRKSQLVFPPRPKEEKEVYDQAVAA